MKVHFIEGRPSMTSQYTQVLLRKLCELNGLEITSAEEAEIVMVSICDVDSLPLLKRAREIAQDKPLVMGGMEAFVGIPYLAWADYVWVGEGFEALEVLGQGRWKDFCVHPSVLSRDKLEAVPSTRVDWETVPLVKTGKGEYYFLVSRGCAMRCKFCFVGWVHPWQKMRLGRIHTAVEQLSQLGDFRRTKLHLITNDSMDVPIHDLVINPSMRLRDILKLRVSEQGRGRKYYHIGIERFSEEGRKEWGKPITNSEIISLFSYLKEVKHQAELFFIIGLPETLAEFEEFISILPMDTALKPVIHLKFTYFNPCPHTPLELFDLSKLIELDTRKMFFTLLSQNRRLRSFFSRSAASQTYNAMFKRCTPEEAIRLKKPAKGETLSEYLKGVEKSLGSHLISGDCYPYMGIKTPWRCMVESKQITG